MSVVSVYAVFANEEEATRIGRLMVEERLAACVNLLGPIRSIYRWHGKIEEDAEAAGIFKTSAGAVDELITRIAALHSYDVPCIVTWPVDKAPGSYAAWVQDSSR